MCLTLTLTLTQARTPKLIKYGMGSIILVPTKLSDPTQWAGFRYLDPANIENKTRNTHTQFFSHWHLCDASFNSAGFPFFLFPFCYIYLCCSMSLSVHKTLSNDWSIQMCPPYINCNFLSVRLMFEEVRKCLWLPVPGSSCCRFALVSVQWQTVVKYVHNNVSQAQ